MNISTLVPHSVRSHKILGDPYLKVQLEPTVYAVLLMKQVLEVMEVPASRLTPMPNMPACVLGLVNRRSRVFWTVDLAKMLGMGCLDSSLPQHTIAIIRVGQTPLGVSVQHVEGMCWLAPEAIQSPPNYLPSTTSPYLNGCVLQDQEVLLVLSAESIVRSPVLHQN